jgi:ATP-binding cassette, subfamily B, multidrug efflux pump
MNEDALGKAVDARLLKRIARFVSPHAGWLMVSLALIPPMVGLELAQPYLLKVAIDRYIASGNPDGLGWVTALFVALVVGHSGIAYLQLWSLSLVGQRATSDLRVALHRHVLGLRATFFDRTPVGRLLTRLTNDVDAVQEMFASGLVTLVADVLKLIGIIVMLFILDARLAMLTFLALPILGVIVEVFRRRMRDSFRLIRQKVAELNAYVGERVGGIKVVQLFTRERDVARGLDAINAEHRDAYFSSLKADASLYAVVEMLGSVSVAAIVWYGGARVASGALSFGLVVAFIHYTEKFFVPVRDLSAKYAVMQAAMASSERIFQLLDTNEPDAPVDAAPGSRLQAPGSEAVSFDHVSFAYSAGEEILHEVGLKIGHGQTVAVVGATGSGKSTLVKLLVRLYEPGAGRILLHGRDLRAIPRDELRRRVTVVPQDVFLFSGTLRDNLGVGPGDARAALTRVGLDRLLARRGGGDPLDLPVVERGANFSAGERQLVAFARALVRDPEILVLDEATASIDPGTEALLERAIRELLAGRTALVVAHRLSTIRRADRVVVMGKGRVLEEGSHDELVARDGRYALLHRLSVS